MGGIWDFWTPMKQLPLRVQHPPSAVAWKGTKWMASIWAELSDFGSTSFHCCFSSWKWRRGYCSVVVLYSTGWWLWSSLMSYWVKDSLSVCTWQVSMAAGGDEGMGKVCRKQNWFPLCCMMEKILSDKTVFGLTLATWVWKNKNNKCAPVGQRSWLCCTRLKLK